MSRACPHADCGHENQDNAKYCARCGRLYGVGERADPDLEAESTLVASTDDLPAIGFRGPYPEEGSGNPVGLVLLAVRWLMLRFLHPENETTHA